MAAAPRYTDRLGLGKTFGMACVEVRLAAIFFDETEDGYWS
jgi:hypothetical protein